MVARCRFHLLANGKKVVTMVVAARRPASKLDIEDGSTSMSNTEKLQREKEFHNRRFGSGEDIRAGLLKYYAANRHMEEFYTSIVASIAKDSSLLEYGCGRGERSTRWPNLGAEVTGIDISPKAISRARRRAARRGFEAEYIVMDAENTTFENDTFDVVVGSGIIHHQNL
jgi:2-polyprenyl-3-methyl-5-hydroxy-6-metoxy-1,4-benzoquinol methylase